MTPEAFEALSAHYNTDPNFRNQMDAADSAEDAVRIAAESGFAADASDIARLSGGNVELSADLLDAMSGGGPPPYLNFTIN